MKTSRGTIRRIIKGDLGYESYKVRVAPKVTDQHKAKRRSFGTWISKNITKSMTKKKLFADEKYFRINGIVKKQNDRIYAATRDEADDKGSIHHTMQFSSGVMVELRMCYEGVTRSVIIEEGAINSERYINEILPVALEDREKMLDSDFIFQQDNAPADRDKLTQHWCKEYFPHFWTKDRWLANSPDLNPLDYSIWGELHQQIDWRRVTSRQTLIDEIKQGMKKIRTEIVRRSVCS
ncbi:unnamed protein product [Rotaria sp. Silwood2]|nr:unnamed protein product [Rotaria sp. Silwood2]CAF4209377.1 unnamed protein product [Rotaria sp. Silwood2]